MDKAKALAASWARSFMAAALALYMAGVQDPSASDFALVEPKRSQFRTNGEVIRKLAAVGLGLGISLSLTACGYQGWTRYECQEFENWSKPECQPPACLPTGTCTDDILGFESEQTSPTQKP